MPAYATYNITKKCAYACLYKCLENNGLYAWAQAATLQATKQVKSALTNTKVGGCIWKFLKSEEKTRKKSRNCCRQNIIKRIVATYIIKGDIAAKMLQHIFTIFVVIKLGIFVKCTKILYKACAKHIFQ